MSSRAWKTRRVRVRGPTIDISGFEGGRAASARVVSDVRRACESVGFFQLVNHGVPEDTLRLAMSAARAFFERPLEEKMAAADLKKGYIPVGGCDNAVRPTSMHEKFSCARVDGVESDPYYGGDHPQARLYFGDDNRWPTAPAHFRDAYVAYYKASSALVARLLRVFAVALGGDADSSAKLDKHVTNLVALRYPPVARRDGDERETERVKPHTDPTDVTVLAFERGPEGLQVWPEGGETEWIDAGDVRLLHRRLHRAPRQPRRRASVLDQRQVAVDETQGGGHRGEGRGGQAEPRVFPRAQLRLRGGLRGLRAYVVGPDRPRKYAPFKSGERTSLRAARAREEGLPDRQTLRPDARGEIDGEIDALRARRRRKEPIARI